MKITLSGATGFTGSHLLRALKAAGHDLKFIDRKAFSLPDDEFRDSYINGQDAVINLAGAPIIRRWTAEWKKEIYDSRILTTRKIAGAIFSSQAPPATFISASAVGIYDDSVKHTEESRAFAKNWLATICRDWETEAFRAAERSRTVVFRTGIVLSKNEGALEKLAPPFKLGMGSRIGNGEQGVSWIHIEDLTRAYLFVLENTQVSGIVNAVGEFPTDNYYFSEALGRVFQQPVYFSIPRVALKIRYGEGAVALTEGQKVIPQKLLQHGFVFNYPTIEKALKKIFA